jgi:two-component system, NarL family, nitrate/nitrite response regulator NarL
VGHDHILFLDALRVVLRQHGHTVGAVARSSAELVAQVGRERPDACLINRPAFDDDVEMIGRVLGASDGTRVLILSVHSGSEAACRAVGAGASGYLHQSQGIGALVTAIERVLHGEVVIGVPETAPRWPSAQPDQALRLAAHLTSREWECLMMLVEGLDTGAIMRRLGISRTTVRTHLQSVLTKLGVHSRLEAVCFAVRHRLPGVWPDDGLAAAARTARPGPLYEAAGALGVSVAVAAAEVAGEPAGASMSLPAGPPAAGVAVASEALARLGLRPWRLGGYRPACRAARRACSATAARGCWRRPLSVPGARGPAGPAWEAWVVIVGTGVGVAETARPGRAPGETSPPGWRLFAQGERRLLAAAAARPVIRGWQPSLSHQGTTCRAVVVAAA